MELKIKSKILDCELIFSRPGEDYIYVDLNGKPGMLGKQICHGGELLGSTLSYSGENEENFKIICRNWYRSYVKKEQKMI